MSYRLENIVYLENEQYFFYLEYFIYKSESIHEIFVIVYVWGGVREEKFILLQRKTLSFWEKERERNHELWR